MDNIKNADWFRGILSKYKKNGVLFLEKNDVSEDIFLSKMAANFRDIFLSSSLFETLSTNIPNGPASRMMGKIYNSIVVDHNRVLIPYRKITDIINLSISSEGDYVSESKVIKFMDRKLSDIIINGISGDTGTKIKSYDYSEIKSHYENLIGDFGLHTSDDEKIIITFS